MNELLETWTGLLVDWRYWCSLMPSVSTYIKHGVTGPKGEGGLDDATGQGGSKQQSSVINQGLGDTQERETWDIDGMLKKMSLQSKADKAEETEGWSFRTLFGGKK